MFESVLDRRDDSCTDGAYTTPDGLVFQITCDNNVSGGDLRQITGVTLDGCMDACSTNDPLCHGVAYNVQESKCWMKNVTSTGYNAENGTHAAIASEAQLTNTNTTCPYSNEVWKETSSGLEFQIYCNKDMADHDLDPSNWSYWPHHADSLMDCMQLCAEAHPLCLGVSWNADMTSGFANCYPKTSGDAGLLNIPATYTTHSAIASYTYPNSSCGADSTYSPQSSTSNKTFRITCQETISNNTIMSTYADTIEACIDECDSYQNQTQPCTGVVFDNTLSNGYENCYLKPSSGPTSSATNYTVAVLSNDNSTSTTNSSGKSSGSNKGVIAGATVGGIAALVALIALVYFWLRSRRNKNRELASEPEAVGYGPTYKDSPGYGGGGLADKQMTHELLGPQQLHESQSEPVHELLGSQLMYKSQNEKQVYEMNDHQAPHELQGGSIRGG